MRSIFIMFIIVFYLPPSIVSAHGETDAVVHHDLAPDLHPLMVLGEFVIVMFLGYLIAGWLSRIGEKRE